MRVTDEIREAQIKPLELKDDGRIPNSALPLLIYRKAFDLSHIEERAALVVEKALHTNNWVNSWRNGIFNYHHYHSTAHEVLAVYSGEAEVMFGGENGSVQRVEQGDVIVIPAGVGHKRLQSKADFRVVGAYPEGQEWDLCYGHAEERPQVDRNIAAVPLPETDPIYGPDGPLMELWSRS